MTDVTLSHKDFSYHERAFFSEASLLETKGWTPRYKVFLEGKQSIVKFDLDRIARDGEGEIVGWQYTASHNGTQYWLHIIND